MKNVASSLFVASALQTITFAAPAGQDEPLEKRLDNGLGKTPALGYNNWVNTCYSKRVSLDQCY
jgi:alpha-galactosidase